jgi:NSS family neurotransmitter:Na+ symporter
MPHAHRPHPRDGRLRLVPVGVSDAVSFVFKPDPHKLKASGVLEALGHAFFTLSLGMGAMITYGSYQKSKERIVGQSFTIAILDTFIAFWPA